MDDINFQPDDSAPEQASFQHYTCCRCLLLPVGFEPIACRSEQFSDQIQAIWPTIQCHFAFIAIDTLQHDRDTLKTLTHTSALGPSLQDSQWECKVGWLLPSQTSCGWRLDLEVAGVARLALHVHRS
jgi:hypothetical protein